MVNLEKEQEAAGEIEKVTAVEEAAANKIYVEVSEIKADCEAVLAEAMPGLHKALKALDTLNKQDISEMKNYGSPPADLVMVVDAICILLGKKTLALNTAGKRLQREWCHGYRPESRFF